MKKQLVSIALIAAFSSACAWSADPVVNIKVTGDIKPPTCTINNAIQSDIIFDYGAISPSLIPQSTAYIYPTNIARNDVIVTCDAATYLTFVASDTYGDAPLSENNTSAWFHLVNTQNTSKSVGAAFFFWSNKNTTVDGEPAYISRANDVAITGTAYTDVLYKGPTNGWTATKQSGTSVNELDLISGKVFKTSFGQGASDNVRSFIMSRDQLTASDIDITNGLDFIGEAVLTFNFGV